jgi:transcriptional regulator with XRE-family HTH domain
MSMPDERLEVKVGRRLREARISAQITVREAADAVGLPSHSILVRYENGTTRPPLDRLAALAVAYGTTLAALLAERDELVPLIAAAERADAVTVNRLQAILELPSASRSRPEAAPDVPF